MIYVGIDDTDTLETPGTNQLAKELARLVAGDYDCRLIVRHQLFFDPRVPYTSKNGSASLTLVPRGQIDLRHLFDRIKHRMQEWYVHGSDPGLCVTAHVPPDVTAFGQLAKQDLVTQAQAAAIAQGHGIHLEGLGGTDGGVIGALAAVGLIVTGDDGRVVRHAEWADDLMGPTPLEIVHARGIEVRDKTTGKCIQPDFIDVGKHLRPNLRAGRVVLFAERQGEQWHAVKLV